MRLGVEVAIVDGALVSGDVEITNGRLTGVAAGRGGGRGIAVPGFVDLQVNGFGGVDFLAADAAGYRTAGDALLQTGVTAFQPTFITAPEDDLVAALREVPVDSVGPKLVGVHLEGPFLSPDHLGAHPAHARRDPDPRLLERLLGAGRVSQMTLAPELEGALELVDRLRERNIVVSAGHTAATTAEAHAAFDRGVTTVTHLFNAMRQFRHRDPGIAAAALARDDVLVQVIVDGRHLADETVRLVWRAAAGRLALVTDAIAAAGVGDGRYRLGGVDVEVRGGVARTPDGVLAGSVVTMLDAVRGLHRIGVPLVEAVGAATATPARIAQRPDLGVLQVGGPADLAVLDDRLELRTVLVDGVERTAS